MSELAPPPHPMLRRGQRIDVIAARERQIGRLQAQQRLEVAALLREDRGGIAARFVRDELALCWDRSPRQAQGRLEDAVVFAAFPAVAGRVADGTWLMDHADAVLDELVGSGLTHHEQEQVLELVLTRRGGRTPWELRAQVRTAVVVLFPDHAAERAAKAARDRDVTVWSHTPGVAALTAEGPGHLVAAMMTALDTMTWPPAPGDTRTAAQRRFDTLLDLVCGQAQPAQWQVQVLVSLATVEGRDELPAEIPGLGVVPAPLARQIVADGASLRRVVVDDHGRLVAVDDTVHRPDLTPRPVRRDDPAARPAPQRGVDLDEPEPVEPDPDAPTLEDQRWLEQHPTGHEHDQVDTGMDALRDRQLSAAPERTEPERAEPERTEPRWSAPALATALHRLRTDPLRPLDLHTSRYAVPRRLKRHLELRDKTCIFPGCPRRAAHCDKDHLIPWPRGATAEPNLADECEPHHLAKHHCFSVTRLPDGTFRWTSPTGRHHDRAPEPVLEAWAYARLLGIGQQRAVVAATETQVIGVVVVARPATALPLTTVTVARTV